MASIKCMGCMKDYDEALNVCPHCGYQKDTPVKELYHLKPGTIINKKYIVGKVLGFGGFGITYIGWDALLEKVVAIKEYLPSEFATRMEGTTLVTAYDGEKTLQFQSGLESFVKEALRLAKFNHLSGIVHIFDSFIENNTAYIVMEYLGGSTLKEILKQRGKLTYQEAVDIAIPVLESLQQVHEKGIIHRDIAPDNIIITDDGRVKLIDFGAARYATTVHSKSLSVVLKPGYAPEEQYRTHGEQGPWSDVYAMGATLYRAITGEIPQESLERKSMDNLKDISEFVPDIPKPLENAIMNSLNVNKDDRIQSAKELADALTGVSEVERNKIKQKRADEGKWTPKMKITALASSIIAIAVVITLVLNSTGIIGTTIKRSTMPDLYGMSVTAAEKELKGCKLELSVIDNIYDDSLVDSLKENTIQQQSIRADSTIKDGVTVVEVKIYAGAVIKDADENAKTVKIPNVYGAKQANAISILESQGLKVSVRTEENDNFVGTVFRQSPASGQEVDKGTTVTITVGRASANKTTRTNPANKDNSSSTKTTTTTTTKTITYTQPIVCVFPNSSSTTTTTTTTTKPVVQYVTVPNVINKASGDAKSLLQNSGLRVNVVTNGVPTSNSSLVGKVASQSPSGGSTVKPNTVVTINLYYLSED